MAWIRSKKALSRKPNQKIPSRSRLKALKLNNWKTKASKKLILKRNRIRALNSRMSLWQALNRCPICCRESEIKSQIWRNKTTCCERVKILWLFWENNSTCTRIFSWSKMTYRTSKLNWILWSRNGKMSLAICSQKWMRSQLPVLSSLPSWSTSLTNC